MEVIIKSLFWSSEASVRFYWHTVTAQTPAFPAAARKLASASLQWDEGTFMKQFLRKIALAVKQLH